MANQSNTSAKRLWGPFLTVLLLTGFVSLALVAKSNPVLSGEEKAKKKNRKVDLPTPTKKAEERKTAKRPTVDFSSIKTSGTKLSREEISKLIDTHVQKRLEAEKVSVGTQADDSEFLRRVYLDLVGAIPTPQKVKSFLDSKDPEKRAKLIDELLTDARFGKYLGETFSNIMVPRESNNRRLDDAPLRNWMADHFNKNTPLNVMVYQLLTSTGSTDENGAVTYFVSNPTVDKITDNVTRTFMGVQLQCAQCHNHPFTDYKQVEYWGMASFFMKVKLTVNPQQAAKKGVSPGIVESATAKGKKQMLPDSAKIVPAKFLSDVEPKLNSSDPARPVLAKWMTSPDNKFFAKAMVNRFWYQMFGRGLVNPVDDIHDENEASHPELLAELTNQLKLHDFDLKFLIRAICNSQTYQRSSKLNSADEPAADLYAHRTLRVLTPEQLFDSLAVVLGKDEGQGRVKGEKIAGKKGPAGGREGFISFFRVEEFNPLDYQAGIPQALRLMNSAQSNNANGAVTRAMTETTTPAQVIENLYLSSLARRPTTQESERMQEYLRKTSSGNPRSAYGDILWALINSSEFVLNH